MGVSESKQGVKKGAKSPQTLTMSNLDINKYLGTWYEIAHTAGSDGSRCNNAIASYTKTQIPGVYQVTNTCYLNGEKVDSMTGTLRMPDPNSPSKLKVRFEGIFEREFDYWIYWTDYKYALVGSPSGHVWILARENQIGLCVFRAIRGMIQRLGLAQGMTIEQDFESLRDCSSGDQSSAVAIDGVYSSV